MTRPLNDLRIKRISNHSDFRIISFFLLNFLKYWRQKEEYDNYHNPCLYAERMNTMDASKRLDATIDKSIHSLLCEENRFDENRDRILINSFNDYFLDRKIED